MASVTLGAADAQMVSHSVCGKLALMEYEGPGCVGLAPGIDGIASDGLLPMTVLGPNAEQVVLSNRRIESPQKCAGTPQNGETEWCCVRAARPRCFV